MVLLGGTQKQRISLLTVVVHKATDKLTKGQTDKRNCENECDFKVRDKNTVILLMMHCLKRDNIRKLWILELLYSIF